MKQRSVSAIRRVVASQGWSLRGVLLYIHYGSIPQWEGERGGWHPNNTCFCVEHVKHTFEAVGIRVALSSYIVKSRVPKFVAAIGRVQLV